VSSYRLVTSAKNGTCQLTHNREETSPRQEMHIMSNINRNLNENLQRNGRSN
jgi:hypothetical protein